MLVIGIGNRQAGDDAAGREVARRLAVRRPPGVEVVESDGFATDLLELWRGRRRVVLVDACSREGDRPGTVHRFDAAAGPLPADLSTPSSHGLGPAQAVELARALGHLPAELTVYAVEGRHFAGPGLSPPVAAAVERLADTLAGTLASGAAQGAASGRGCEAATTRSEAPAPARSSTQA